MHLVVRSAALARARARAALAALAMIVVVAPFEWELVTIAGAMTVTTVEAALVVALVAIAVAESGRTPWPRRGVGWAADRRSMPGARRRDPLLLPGAVWLAVLLAAAVAVAVDRDHALRFTARMGMAALTYLACVRVARSERRARATVWLLLAVATAVAAIAVLEAAQVPAVMNALTWFRPGFHVVGGQLRATSTLVYPTITSMYLEIAFAFGLWVLLEPGRERPAASRRLAFGALMVIGAGIAVTLTRSGLLALGACLALLAAVTLARAPRQGAHLVALGALTAVLAVVVVLAQSPEFLATRLRTEGSQAWYGARYDVPATLRLDTGRTHLVPITITNTGRLTWDSGREPAFTMSYHWLRDGSAAVIQFEGDRTPFPAPVRPGMRLTLPVAVTAPAVPGTYTLAWDAVHETRAWLSTEGVPSALTTALVEGEATGVVVTRMSRLPGVTVRPARPALWRAALGVAADHPWLGVGPDNFRHVYGRYAGVTQWDTRVHANNMYLEMLTGAGVPGLLSFLWLIGAAGWALGRRCWSAPRDRLVAATAALAAWMVVVGHGLVDSFLSFTTTYVTFAIAAGLAFSPRTPSSEAEGQISPATRAGDDDANCV